MPEDTGFTGSVVADWLQNNVASLLPYRIASVIFINARINTRVRSV